MKQNEGVGYLWSNKIRTYLEKTAQKLLCDWRGNNYSFGVDVLKNTGEMAGRVGEKILVVANSSAWMAGVLEDVKNSLSKAGLTLLGTVEGCRPNSPYDDVFRVRKDIAEMNPNTLVAVGGGSTIDGVKAAAVLAAFDVSDQGVDVFFGIGKVRESINQARRRPCPVVAVQCASGSAAHLTKYSNITDFSTNQKKLIIDDVIIPSAAVFDYSATLSAGRDLTLDGAFDGIAHLLEVFFGAKAETIDRIEPIALCGLELIISALPEAVNAPKNLNARVGLGLGTDLGGYAIMVGSTNGPHLNSFSLVDVMPHGRACALLLPYYTVLFSRAIQRQLESIAPILHRCGYMEKSSADGRDVALALQNLARTVGFPTRLSEVSGVSEEHIYRMLKAAQDPALVSKLQNMPIPISPGEVEKYMRPLLSAAFAGNLDSVVQL